MVRSEALRQRKIPASFTPADFPEGDVHWCTVSLGEILQRGRRLEASVFDIEGKQAHEILNQCKWPIMSIWGKNRIARNVFVPGRVKRIYLRKDCAFSVGFLGSSEMLDIRPIPYKWLSKNDPKYEQFNVDKNFVLISCSGTIGNLSYVSGTLTRFMVSQHAIRIVCDHPGYIYSFLKTNIGKALVKSNIYGAVINEIEPEHFENVPIPNPPVVLKRKIHNLISRSYTLRDESNVLLEEAESLLYKALKLPALENIKPRYFDNRFGVRNYTVKLSKLSGRLDASYHAPIVNSILRCLKKEAIYTTSIGDPKINLRIFLPGRFKRIYVQKDQGVPFFGGKQIRELDPSNKKYLSSTLHYSRIKHELKLHENMVLVTRSGTIGKVALVPKHWINWVASEHIIRIVPSSHSIAGYLYVFLSTDYGRELIKRFTYGSVVDEINDDQVAQTPIPILKDKDTQNEINRLALSANKKRYQAYLYEQKAINLVNDEVIHA